VSLGPKKHFPGKQVQVFSDGYKILRGKYKIHLVSQRIKSKNNIAFFLCFDTGSHYVAQAGLELVILLPLLLSAILLLISNGYNINYLSFISISANFPLTTYVCNHNSYSTIMDHSLLHLQVM
jgi:hypothetical protein